MRTWLKVLDNLDSMQTMIGHSNYGIGQFAHDCDFCEARRRRVEAAYTVIYDSEMLEPPNNVQKVNLCTECSKPAIDKVGIQPRNKQMQPNYTE